MNSPSSSVAAWRYTIPLLLVVSAFSASLGYGALAAVLALGCAVAMPPLFGKVLERAGAAEFRAENLQGELIHSQKLASIGQLSAGVAHEINTPLNIMLQEAELISLLVDGELPISSEDRRQVADSAERIRREAKRCGEITHKLLDFSRKHVPVRQKADINKLAGDMIALVEREAAGRSIKVVRKLAPELPLVVTDPPLVRQILLNLLNNATQAVNDGGTITVSTFYEDGMVNTEVQDDGPGVSQEIRDKVFHPFFTTKDPGKGTGLGLSIGLRIARELGGDIVLYSPQGQGAIFTLRLPLTAEEVPQ